MNPMEIDVLIEAVDRERADRFAIAIANLAADWNLVAHAQVVEFKPQFAELEMYDIGDGVNVFNPYDI